MTDDEWARIADRIASTWPGPDGDAEGYREHLDDLPPEAVERALDDLLIEYRNEPPPPRAVRERALDAPGAVAPAGRDRDDGEADDGAGEPVEAYRSEGAPEGPRQSPKATVALILGVAGLITIPIVFSIAAIVVGTRALREIAASPGLGGATRARLGRALGWFGIAVMAIVVVVGLVVGQSA